MPRYYQAAMEAGDEAALLAACPDHYVLCQDVDGLQKVIETTGGSPLSARILLDESDIGTVTTVADPEFPVQWVAVGRGSSSDRPAGAIRHQFRDEPNGFRVRLTGEFPVITPPHLIRAHQWHLACEFSNWIEAANAGRRHSKRIWPEASRGRERGPRVEVDSTAKGEWQEYHGF